MSAQSGASAGVATEPVPCVTPEAAASRPLLPWLGYFLAWVGIGLWLGINVVIGHRNSGSHVPAWEPMTWELSSAAVMAVLAIAIFRFERRHPLSGSDWLRRVPVHVPAAIAFSLLHTLGMATPRPTQP